MRQKTKLNIVVALFVSVLMIGIGQASAATKSKAVDAETSRTQAEKSQGRITESYNADSSVQIGMIVALKDKDSKTVVPLKEAQVEKLLGIVVPQAGAAIVLTPQQITQQQVLVSTSGRNYVLVSNQNGPIKTGDYVSISAIDGVAMKTTENQSQVVGKAAGDFAGNAHVISSVKLKDTNGKETAVAIGRIPIDINVAHNPLFSTTLDYVPGFLSNSAQTVSGKPVSAARIYLSIVILGIIAFVSGNILYSGVKSGMNAVSRNPLSKKSIIRSLIETIIAGIIVFLTGVFAVYLLLKL